MRIQTGTTLTAGDVYDAASFAQRVQRCDIHVQELDVSPRGGITFYCESFHGNRRTNRRAQDDTRAASWTAWGWLLAELFNRDPNAVVGTYRGVDDFKRQCRAYTPKGESLDFLTHLNERTEVTS